MSGSKAINQDNGTKLDALLFFVRKYGTNLLIAILSGVVLYFIFYFYASDITLGQLKKDRVHSTTATEAVFSGLPQSEGEGFFNLNGTHILENGKRVNCDLLMVRSGAEYSDNYFAFDLSLKADECAVSNNLMKSYGIKVGQALLISGTDTVYTVRSAIEASEGIDKEYLHEGVIILGFDQQLLAQKDHSYITFMRDADGISDLHQIVFLNKELQAAESEIVSGLIFTVLFIALAVFLWELLLARRRFADLRRFAELGARPCNLFLKVFSGILFKYFLPFAAVCLIWYERLGCFGVSYLYPVLLISIITFLILTVYSVLLFRRVSLCRMKKR